MLGKSGVYPYLSFKACPPQYFASNTGSIKYIFFSSFLAFMSDGLVENGIVFGQQSIYQLFKSTNLLEINPFSAILLC